ncbi:MAG TPA: lytic murein transglycosylase [Microvirga sp.]|jgi:lytic murein transglycosylase|nr:lytic murein transglycosylase [Microvirga sp.]
MSRRALETGRTLCGAILISLQALACTAAAGPQDPLATATLPIREVETTGAGAEAQAAEFRRFVEGLRPEAEARGVSRATFDDAFRDVTPDPKVVALSRKQSEFVRPIWDYVNGAITAQRVERGAQAAAQWSEALAAAERTYGVPRSVILGIWGMETNFGSFTGNLSVVRSLATLAFTGYRAEFFRAELLTALQILEQDHIARASMLGSWAGAMGQTQFMPSSFMKFAVDGDRDGRRDIWTSAPDAIASTANYLREQGWQPGLPWGFEVVLPQGFDFRNLRHGFASWAGLGLKRADGKALPAGGEATLFLPGGARGPAFLVTDNYAVIKTYNSSDAYALGVAHLGDRVTGGRPLQGAWPVAEPQLDKDQRLEVQKRLAALGFYAGEADGRLGSKTREAVRGFQLQRGLAADGYADVAILRELRAAR